MNRTLVGVVLVFTLVLFIGVMLMFYLALGSNGSRDVVVSGANLAGPGSITLGSGFEIEAADETDAYYLLGYAHGRAHPWTVILLRQAALGRLGEWFGDDVLPIDRLARCLALASVARSTVEALPVEEQRLLRSYARGVSDAFKTREVIMDEDLVLFNVLPEPWESWHSIALERLFAWLSEPPERAVAGDTAFQALRDFQQADESLRDLLHLHGFDHSSAWAYDDSIGTSVVAQFVYGATTLPLMIPAGLTWPGVNVYGVSLLGTPFFPFATGPGGIELTLISSPRQVRNRFAAGYPDSVATNLRYERITLASGREELMAIPYMSDVSFFSAGSFTGDSPTKPAWGTVRWAGFEPVSDWPAWRQRLLEIAGKSQGSEYPFRLIAGDGLSVAPNGGKSIRGHPTVVQNGPSASVFVAVNPLAEYAARRFQDRMASPGNLGTVATDVTSTWAEDNLHVALGALKTDRSFSPAVREAIEYLKNWDFKYNLASIGAPIFDTWMETYAGHGYPYPTIVFSGDSLERAEAVARLEDALRWTVDSLAEVAGPDPARWRLESFRKSNRYFPVWSYAPLAGKLPSLNPLRYAPISIQQSGHPTTIAWESGLFDYPSKSPAHVIASARLSGSPGFSFRPDYRIGSGVIARHVVAAPEDLPLPFPTKDRSARIVFRRSI